MDPLTAFSLASSIAQLIDFGSKLVARGFRIYRSADGSLVEHVSKEAATDHLVYLLAKLQAPVTSGLPYSIENEAENQALHALCSKCHILGEELLATLQSGRVEGKNRGWKSFRQALRSVATEDAISKIETELEALKEELEFHVLVDLRKNVNLLSVQHSSQFEALDQASQEIMRAIINNERIFTDGLSTQMVEITKLHRQTETSINYGLEQLSRDIIQELQGSRGEGLFRDYSGEDVVPKSRNQFEEENQLREYAILHSLSYSTMGNRHRDILEGHKDTFKWMFDGIEPEGEDAEAQSSNFVEWLKNGDGIYCINGKAGSGKSTLMRYLYNHPHTRQYLLDWSGTHILHIGGFFFWNSGTSDQRTQSGLFRSLLHEILSQQRDWIRELLPDRWVGLSEWVETASRSGVMGQKTPLPPRYKWSLRRLREVFTAMVNRKESSARFCLFIDGLDEYDGECGHAELVDILTDLTKSKQVKVCVSSRPWIIFEDAFQDLPGVKLESLTYDDIKNYVTDILGKNPRMVKLCQAEPDEAPKLMEEIVTKAQGVFLWVELVVRSLLSGLANRDRIRDLQARLRLLPEKLEDLYKVMLLRIDPYYRHQASQLFRLVQVYQKEINSAKHNLSGERSPLTILLLAFADSEDVVSMAIESPIIHLTKTELASICEAIDTRLRSRCAGLLETSASKNITHLWTSTTQYDKNSRVEYIHRTARDFLESPETQALLLSWNKYSNPKYSIELLAACILELKSVTLGASKMWESIANAMAFAQETEQREAKSRRELLDELDKSATKSWIQFRQTGPRREDPDLHWSHYVPLQYDGSSASCRDGFVLYVAQHGLRDYVEYKRRKTPECFTRKTLAEMAKYQRDSSVNSRLDRRSQRKAENPWVPGSQLSDFIERSLSRQPVSLIRKWEDLNYASGDEEEEFGSQEVLTDEEIFTIGR